MAEGQRLEERRIVDSRDELRDGLAAAGKLHEAYALASSPTPVGTECTILVADAIGRAARNHEDAIALTLAIGLGAAGYLGRVFVAADRQILVKLSQPMPDGQVLMFDQRFKDVHEAVAELAPPKGGTALLQWILSLEAVGGADAATESLDRLGDVLEQLERA